ncbi:GUN4 domain-containing protein [Pseudanabaena sp. FACHB-1998]|uniref:GUN4 domain-containing protein n=1 Tax=Pseudanabaena sp. FACHB-1998 TaxID=2692858 RepID=UPI0016801943|nr:GUN4 domain-containing protein [Pseudanabaena sp. FACHB-1998]MBD2175481.1 GUN4 domain-containing protein [Pseudanabaena sp. FACHB-1998]
MARNCAVIVGINDYDEISPLKYAKSDAERMRDFFMQDLGVSQDDLYFFTDDSPRNAQGRKTQPTYGTLKSFLGDRFANPFLSAGDTLWFYFSGHGMPCEGRDYLLPSDGNPRSIPDLAIPIGYVTERLRRSGADNVVMLIDACRSDGAKNAGMGIGEEKQQGVITFFSCSPSQVSYEIDEIGQGAFTNVLLEALRIQGEGNCATVERFYQFLRTQVPRLTQRYKNYVQTPYAAIEPATKLHYILLPKFANLTDIGLLREEAGDAELEGDFALAFQLWLRVNVAAGGTDIKAIKAFQRLANKQSAPNSQTQERISDQGSKTPSVSSISPPAVPKELQRDISRTTLQMSLEPEVTNNLVNLLSTKGIDYCELENLLKNKQWYEADKLTDRLMLKASGREKERWIDLDSIKNFPCEDLQTIDRLWVHYSNGLYGFSVQKKIYVECGGKLNFSNPIFNSEPWKRFCDRTAWKSEGRWVEYHQPFFKENFMCVKGHLPFYRGCGNAKGLDFYGFHFVGEINRMGGWVGIYFFSRIETCEV